MAKSLPSDQSSFFICVVLGIEMDGVEPIVFFHLFLVLLDWI